MSRFIVAACAAAIVAATGCSSSKEEASAASTGSAATSTPAAAPSGAASAEQVAQEMRGGVKCPAKDLSPRPAGAPVDDVVGVRPGMTWDEAANFVMCDNPLMVVTENTGRNFNINTYGLKLRQGFDGKFAEPRVVKTSRDYLREMSEEAARRSGNAYVAPLQPGQSRFYVSTMGMPGQERVMSVAREEYYADGKQPTIESLQQALVGKYGPPSYVNDGGTVLQMWWTYDPAGTKFAQGECRTSVSPDAGTSLSTGCGLTVGAQIQASNTNTGLVHSLAVTAQNGIQGYKLLQLTENTLKSADDARKAKELQDASKNAGAPKL
jgi:hypothetical protein